MGAESIRPACSSSPLFSASMIFFCYRFFSEVMRVNEQLALSTSITLKVVVENIETFVEIKYFRGEEALACKESLKLYIHPLVGCLIWRVS